MLYKLLGWQRLLGLGILVMSVAMHRSMSVLSFSLGVWGFSCVAVFAGACLRGALLGAVWFSGCNCLRGVWGWL